ncbi:MAG TPA: type IV pilus twitching motility protein PilT [Mycobacteriales bacterium]|nr:type IV pilus twitching motility protein PilT [Mycobacteriales bacterium]
MARQTAGARPAPRTATASSRRPERITPIDAYLKKLWEAGGTDLHLTADSPPLLRVNGQFIRYDDRPLSADKVDAIIRQVTGPELAAVLDEKGEVDFSLSWRDHGRLRGNAFKQRTASALALRLIPFEIPSMERLGVPQIVQQMIHQPHGLVLVTGPTGSGKSTTLAAMIDQINMERACHIVTIEDPIEYLHNHKVGVINQREIGQDSESFHTALRAVLREDPDVVLVGEMRDPESIQAALTIAETGHLVFATLHTNDTAQAVDRIVDVFPAERRPQIQVQLAHVLSGVVYQRLLPRVEGGLVAAFEVMLGNHAVRNLIREGKTRQLRNVVATHQSEGMQTLEMHLARLVAEGAITKDTAVAASMFPREIDLREVAGAGRSRDAALPAHVR